jgi:hypothetical protein
MTKKILHMCLDVRGALKNFRPSEWVGCCTDHETGRVLTADEIHDAFCDELAKGHEVIPFGEACEGFDYSGGGCPGHEAPEKD